ncbi:MAG: transporter substrate-binding domain-containing protein [Gammaproteobacteria bacterium]
MKRLRACLPVLCALLASIAAADEDESLAVVQERGVLKVAVYEAFPPFSDRDADGTPRGIDVDIAHELARRLGLTATIRFQPADESVEDDLRNAVWKGHYIGGGVADVMLHVPADPRFVATVEQVRIDGVYYMEDIALAYAQAVFDGAPTLASFTSHRVGVELETIADLYLLSTMNGALRDNVAHYPALARATAALVEGEIPAVMGHRAELEGLLHGHAGIAVTKVAIPGVMISSWPLGAAVKAGDVALGDAVMGHLKAMVDDGTVARIFAAHGATPTPGG